jgi:hypothetical protein
MNPQQGGEIGVSQPWMPPMPHPRRQAPRRPRFSWITVIATVLAAAALVVGVIALIRPTPSASPASAPRSSAPTLAQPQDITTADRALCTAIAPLMTEDDHQVNTYVGLGAAGTPARDAALPKFISDTQDWVRRIQPVVDSHTGTDPFFERTLQRFIDDRKLLAVDLEPGPLKEYDQEIWSDSMAAYGGPLFVCSELGIKW